MCYRNRHIETKLVKVRIHIEIQDFTMGNKDFMQSTIQDIFWNALA